jgi:hypothetical protein
MDDWNRYFKDDKKLIDKWKKYFDSAEQAFEWSVSFEDAKEAYQ